MERVSESVVDVLGRVSAMLRMPRGSEVPTELSSTGGVYRSIWEYSHT